jgi:adenine-specific DNA-methyltransferase
MFENLPSVLCYAGSDDDLMHRMGLEFQNPKPVAFVKSLVQAFTRPVAHDIVLDFFAGSGSTAHAVLEANTEDGGNRSFICVQLPEPLGEKSAMWTRGLRTIADITRARIRAVLEAMNAGGRGKPTVGVQCFCLAPCSEEKEQEGEAATTGILGQVQ